MTGDVDEGFQTEVKEDNHPWYGCERDQDDFCIFDLRGLSMPAAQPSDPLFTSTAFYQSLVRQQDKDASRIPAFADLTPEALSPFKDHSFLLMRTSAGWILRFIGQAVQPLLGSAYLPALSLDALKGDALAPLLSRAITQLDQAPSLYGLVLPMKGGDPRHELHGTLIPLNKASDSFDFALIILTAAEKQIQPLETHAPDPALMDHIQTAKSAVSVVLKQQSSSHESLYGALAATLKLYEESLNRPKTVKALILENQLTVQDRAPFTPLLKLIFGKGYDKTRLTEYAAALSYAWREGISSDDLVAFLTSFPGGIKGCVKAERTLRRQKRGSFAATSLRQAEDILLSAPALSINQLTPADGENFTLVLARQNSKGSLEVVAPYSATPAALETAIRQAAKSLSSGSHPDRSQPPGTVPTQQSQSANQPPAGEEQ